MPDRCRHTPHLMVFPFGQLERDPTIGHRCAMSDRRLARRDGGLRIQSPRATWQRPPAGDEHPTLEERQRFGQRNPFDLRPVSPPMRVPRIEQPGVEPRLITQQKQPLALGIEPSERINPWRQAERCERPVP